MNKKLYISDLDGTLLNKNGEISDKTAELINNFINSGGFFSIATARTAATALIITQKININVPVILMNGVCVYDKNKGEYIKTETLSEEILSEIFDVLHKFKLSGFLFSIDDGILNTAYENADSPHAVRFIKERTEKFNKIFFQTDDFRKYSSCRNVVYYSVNAEKNILDPVYSALKNIRGVHIDYYRDVYDENCWYLEISSEKASKYNAVKYIREIYKFDYVVGFGDNLNDIPMFNACDETYAVENARAEVKNLASGIIPDNNHNGVALKICGLV